jgi:hypothetical protein
LHAYAAGCRYGSDSTLMIDTNGSGEWNGKTPRRGKRVVAFDGVTVRSFPYEEDRYDMLDLHPISMTKINRVSKAVSMEALLNLGGAG